MTDSNNMNVPVISLRHLFEANNHIRGVMKMSIVCRAFRNTRLSWHERYRPIQHKYGQPLRKNDILRTVVVVVTTTQLITNVWH